MFILRLEHVESHKQCLLSELVLCKNDVWEILYKISIFLFVIGQVKKIFSKTIWPN